MRLQLSSPQMRRLQRLQRVLLSPADHDDPEAWSLRVNHDLATLLRTDRCMLVLPRADRTLVSTIGMEPATRDALTNRVSGVGTDRNRYEDPLLDRKMKRLRQAGVVIWNREISERISRIADSEVPFYGDVMHPAGLRRYDVAGVPTRSGMACLVGFHARREENPFGASSLQLFRLLRPAPSARG